MRPVTVPREARLLVRRPRAGGGVNSGDSAGSRHSESSQPATWGHRLLAAAGARNLRGSRPQQCLQMATVQRSRPAFGSSSRLPSSPWMRGRRTVQEGGSLRSARCELGGLPARQAACSPCRNRLRTGPGTSSTAASAVPAGMVGTDSGKLRHRLHRSHVSRRHTRIAAVAGAASHRRHSWHGWPVRLVRLERMMRCRTSSPTAPGAATRLVRLHSAGLGRRQPGRHRSISRRNLPT